MDVRVVRTGALFALLGVGLGAFGAHALDGLLAANQSTATWRTASFYHLCHAIAMLLPISSRGKVKPAWFFAAGIVLFSGSLYLLAIMGWSWLGPITPLGGISFMLGWSILIWQGGH